VPGPAQFAFPLDTNWLFGGKFNPAGLDPGFDDSTFSQITLPHSVVPLSWRKWDPDTWQDVWIYRRHFDIPSQLRGSRLFLHFDRVMAAATPALNGHRLPQHLGGFLPFEYEISALSRDKNNVLAVSVDSRWLPSPPAGSPRGPQAIDYLLPGGITGSVTLRGLPASFIRDAFAKPIDVLKPSRRLEATCTLDLGSAPFSEVSLEAALHEYSRVIATTAKTVSSVNASQPITLTLDGLSRITLWDTDNPHLYNLVVTLSVDGKPMHRFQTRVGFREARFDVDGFFLNGRRTRIFGLNRHELYPYMGYAAPTRVLRRDAEILRRRFNCNAVRCSHYPQSEAFLDACDELGLLVWEETPGWHFVGDQAWQDQVMHNVEDMVRRDRNHPSIVIWGVRVNESNNDPSLYARTRDLAKSLDGTRQTSGSMTSHSEKSWLQDVFAYDDYHSAPDGSVGISPPLDGVPYLLSECVGQYSYGGEGFNNIYRRAGNPQTQMLQAVYHAEAHSRAAAYTRCAGAIAWCAFEYGSLAHGYNAVKCPGIADVFRIPKLGASFYLAQVDPSVRTVIEPNFYWDFGPQTPFGPGEHVAIFSNCERLELFIDGKQHSVLNPDRAGFANLQYPPFFASLKLDGSLKPTLRIDGYIGDFVVLSRSFSSNSSTDRLWLHADDAELHADGSDATRLAFAAHDKFGAQRPFAQGDVSLRVEGPGMIVGDNPFPLGENGGAGAVWIRTLPGRTGQIRVEATHRSLGMETVTIAVRPSRHLPNA
jgi:beta-galactosidase